MVMVASGAVPFHEPVGEEVTGRVRDLVELVLNASVPSDETDIVETGLLDSLALVELLVGIEREFDVQIDLESLDLENLRSVRTIAQTICTARQGTGSTTAPAADLDASS